MSFTPCQNPVNISRFVDVQFRGPLYCSPLNATLTTTEEIASTVYNHPITQAAGETIKTVHGAIGVVLKPAWEWTDRTLQDYTGIGLGTGLQIGSALHGRGTMIATALLATVYLAQAFMEQPIEMTRNMAVAGGHAIAQIPRGCYQTILAAPRFFFITTPVFIANTVFQVFVKFPLYTVPKFLLNNPIVGAPLALGAAYAGGKALYFATCNPPLIESWNFLFGLECDLEEATFANRRSGESFKSLVQRKSERIFTETSDTALNLQLVEALKYLIAHPETQADAISKDYSFKGNLEFLYVAKLVNKYQMILKSLCEDASISEETKKHAQQTLLLIDSISDETIERVKSKLIQRAVTLAFPISKEKTERLLKVYEDLGITPKE